MIWRPLPMMRGCPHCGKQPMIRFRLFRGYRAECACGVAGPFVISEDPERAAMLAWAAVAGRVEDLPRPPPPMPMGVRSAADGGLCGREPPSGGSSRQPPSAPTMHGQPPPDWGAKW